MEVLVDIELSFSVEEIKMIAKAAELNKLSTADYVKQVITNAYNRDLKKKRSARPRAIKKSN